MKGLVAFLTMMSIASTNTQNVSSDCYVVNHETYTECFTYTTGHLEKHENAQKACIEKGGQLPVVTNGTVWKMVTDNLLPKPTQVYIHHRRKKFRRWETVNPQYVWVGLKVSPNSLQYVPNVQFTDTEPSHYSTPLSSTSYYNMCVFALPPNWILYPGSCEATYDYLCQFIYCNISKINLPFKIQSCFTTDMVPNNTVVEIECANGYYLKGNTHITCINGKWEKAQCIPGCPPPGQKRHAALTLVKTSYNIGEKINFICEDEYFSWKDHRMTHFTLICQEDSTWSDQDARCTHRNQFSTIIIDLNEIKSSIMELKCELNAANITWYHNGRDVRNSTAFKIDPVSNLIISTSAEKISGIYFCQGFDNKFEIGNKFYQIIGKNECKSKVSIINQTIVTEGQNILLQCPQENVDLQVKWFKDEKELISNSHGNVITGIGLFIENAQLSHEGTYKCQTTYREESNNCKYNVTHSLFVSASTQSVCGSTSAQIKNIQPWLTVLCQNDEVIPFCYGTLLNSKWVVTSAYCLSKLQRKKKIVGISVIFGPEGKHKRYPIHSIKVHPKYRSRQNQNDIGLIQLQGPPVKFTNDILPACISPIDIGNVHKCEQTSNLNGTVAGWGPLVIDFDDMILDTEEMGIVPKEKCSAADTKGFAEDKFCAKFIGDDEIFAGDSGSPFLVTHNGRQYLLGIHTWGERETRTGDYDFYTSIYYHYNWIKENIG